MNLLIKEIKRIWAALGYSLAGLKDSIKNEAAFQTEVVLMIVLIPLALLLPVEVMQKVFLIESMVLILIVELINVSIESCVNYISKERHPLAKKIKDVASAAVFFCIINCVCMWAWVSWTLLS